MGLVVLGMLYSSWVVLTSLASGTTMVPTLSPISISFLHLLWKTGVLLFRVVRCFFSLGLEVMYQEV